MWKPSTQTAPTCRPHSVSFLGESLSQAGSATYMGRKLEADFPGRSQETRTVFETEEGQEGPEIVIQKVTQQMKDLVIRLRADLHTEMFTPEVSDTIELTRVICDLSSLARSVKEHGAVVACLLKAEAFADTMHRLTNSLDHIPKEILQESFKSFLRSFEVYIGKREAKDIDSKTVIKDFLRDDKKLYRGNEIILHCFCVVAVKFSVESSVESLISRYECHFDKSRQLSQERSTQEMFLSENGPILVGNSYHVLFYDYINITICMALLLCEEILRLLYRCMQTSCLRERWTSSLSVKPIVQHGIFTIQT